MSLNPWEILKAIDNAVRKPIEWARRRAVRSNARERLDRSAREKRQEKQDDEEN
jgi:hypothetical protein